MKGHKQVDMGFHPRPSDVVVAVMGMTGSGKSTQEVIAYRCQYSSSVDIYLIDTPGFDDTNRSDSDILKTIAEWMTRSYINNIKLSGIIYLHRITDTRVQGTAKKNLFMFKKLCGPSAMKNVLLVTTMWENVQQADGERREIDLVNTPDFWGFMLAEGARIQRHKNTRESAMGLLKNFVQSRKITMNIQAEMVHEHKDLDDTEAGREVLGEMLRERERARQEVLETQQMMQEALKERDEQSARLLREHQEKMNAKLAKMEADREKLKVTMEMLHAEKFAKLEKEIERYEKRNDALQQKLDDAIGKLKVLPPPSSTGAVVGEPSRLSRPSWNTFLKSYTNLTLYGSNYYFVGQGKNFGSRHSETWTTNSDEDTRYIAYGSGDSWYRHYHSNGQCYSEWSDSLSDAYPRLARWLEDGNEVGCPIQVTLGKRGRFFIRTQKQRYHSVPDSIKDSIGEDDDWKNVKRLWMGYEHTYVAELFDGTLCWALRQYYPKLERRLLSLNSVAIRDLALNPKDPESYAIVVTSGQSRIQTNNAKMERAFEEFRKYNLEFMKH
ncbi:hypothetical protein Hte_004836 [Hypoxylon texense]